MILFSLLTKYEFLHRKNDEIYKAISFMDGKNSYLVNKENGIIKDDSLSKINIY